jgi:hypothetical protein
MFKFLRQKAGLRGAIGVVAAYAFALQMLLTGLAGAQMAAADPTGQFVTCYGAEGDHGASSNDSGTNTPRVNHVTCVVCGVASLVPPLPEAANPVVFRSGVAAAYVSVYGRRHVADRRHDPKSAQGPPQTV